MRVTRRRVFQLSLLSAGSFAMSLLTGSRESSKAYTRGPRNGFRLDQLHARTFKSLKNRGFKVQTNDGNTLPFTLAKISENKQNRQTEGFSLVFHSQENRVLEQGTYHFSHPSLGNLNLFMVPGSSPSTGQDYVVTFNQLLT